MSESEAAYVAGIVDGEGMITLTRTHRDENRRPVVSISSTELPLLQYVQAIVGAGKMTRKVRVREHRSPSYAYALSNRQALCLLGQITGYLRTYKAERARILLQEYLLVTPRNGRYEAGQLIARQAMEERFFAVRTRLISTLEPSTPTL
jgi:hypothetical protein